MKSIPNFHRLQNSKPFLISIFSYLIMVAFITPTSAQLYLPKTSTDAEAKSIDEIVQSTNNFIGIGTANPTRDLHIQSAPSGIISPYNLTGGLDLESDNITGINILSPNTGNGRIYFGAPSSSTAGALEYIHSSVLSSGRMKFRVAGGDRMFILGNGKVGIGNNSPEGLLDIKYSGTLGGKFDPTQSYLTIGDGNNELIVDNNEIYSNTSLNLGSGYNSDFSFRNVDAAGHIHLMTIKSTGKIGIGVEDPQSFFEIRSSGSMGGKYDPLKSYLQVGDGTNDLILDNNEIYSNSSLNLGSGYNNDISFRNVDAAGHIHLMTIKPTGKIGIGVEDPQSFFEIRSSGSMGGKYDPLKSYLQVGDGTNDLILDNNEIYSSNSLNLGSGYNDDISFRNVDAAGHIHLMTIKSTGKIGIGVEDPQSFFEIRSSGSMGGKYDPLKSYLQVGDGTNDLILDNNEIYSNGSLNLGSGYNDDISFRNVDASGHIHLMTIKPTGKIGIGVEDPVSFFEIRSSGSMAGLYNPSNSYFNLGDGTINMIMDGNEIYTNHKLILGSSYNEDIIFQNVSETQQERLMSIKSDGKIGIGIDEPVAKLDIRHTGTLGSKFNESAAYLRIGDGTNNLIMDGNEIYSNGNLALGSAYNSDISFRNIDATNNDHLMTIKSGGNVGIGTTIPTQKLSVAGKINAEELILEDVTGADFVFEEDYDLRSLEETEEFIKANKHLPEIPSAAEMAEDGLGIKEMNILLLQKVEELTLHLIRQEKEMQKMQNEIHDLKDHK